MSDDIQKRLLKALNHTLGDDKTRTSVLVLGEGINIQAAGPNGPKDSWNQILKSLWAKAGGDPVNFEHLQSTALQWSCLAELYARRNGVRLTSAERTLQTDLCKRVKQLEAKHLESRILHAEILNANFANIVWFNVDRRIVRHVPASRLKRTSANKSLLHRGLRSGNTNVWFPYRDISDPASIQIGHSNYDQRLMEFEDYRDGMMNSWFGWDGSYSQYELRPPAEVYWRLWNKIESWYDLFFLAPLIFVGVSLSHDDWPLWWLLHQRARNFVPFRKSKDYEYPETFYLTCEGADTAHVRGGPAGIELVEFDSYHAMWGFLRKALAKKPK